jgi:hypothetical protein
MVDGPTDRQFVFHAVPGGGGFLAHRIFISMGLFAPRNATVYVTLFICALSVSGAILLILELDRPFEGLIRISPAHLRNTLRISAGSEWNR